MPLPPFSGSAAAGRVSALRLSGVCVHSGAPIGDV